MRVVFLAAAFALAATSQATADDLGLEGRHEGRAFWMRNQAWPMPNPGSETVRRIASSRYTMTYTDALAQRLNIQTGHVDLFQQKLGDGGPALVGTVKGGAAELVLRWHPGE